MHRATQSHGPVLSAALLLLAACPGPAPAPDDLGAGDQAPRPRPLAFRPPVTYPAGATARALAVADLSGDGKPDVAVARADSLEPGVSVLAGRGGGLLAQPTGYRLADPPFAIAIADVNRDRRPDLLLTNFLDRGLTVLPNQSTGGSIGFGARATYPTGAHPGALAVADLSGDGGPDVVVANQAGTSLSLLLSQPDGSFTARPDLELSESPQAVAIQDVTGDGTADLLVLGQAGLLVLRGQGGARFSDKMPAAALVQPLALAVQDLNGDGRADVAVASTKSGSSALSILLGKGDGTFAAANQALAVDPAGLAAGDLDGDGRPDLVVVSSARPQPLVLLGQGDGTFRDPVELMATTRSTGVVLHDLDGDGRLDLLTVGPIEGVVNVYLNDT